MKIYMMIDTSGSMEGAKIQSVNDTMENVIVAFQEAAFNYDADIDIAVLSFARSASWMHPDPIPVTDFSWVPLSASGMTSLGNACKELNESLLHNCNHGEKTVIILMSDGCPTDDYDEGISILEGNVIFPESTRYAIAIGTDADIPSLVRFTADVESIYTVDAIDSLYYCVNDILENSIPSGMPLPPVPPSPVSSDDDDEWA